ncbi:FAD-dependent oxidoreductase [Thermosipho ferrireducens]|uniref:FAD-dependent oxidoreductase n=1 Tax=Thermosipho ferrireducens TaxID=2571116 RepID=A0ABX7S840_9BACT|nr:FAD-dependent oxidoreductase [Thermosipho ferrireducens]QTA37441.1 FAD-dependent oxidoreductase [Thermosipho ferrireducens]
MKIIVIGCTHAGTAFITTAKKLYPDIEITVYERNDNISFLSCGIALHVGGVIKDPQKLFYSSPEKLKEMKVATKMLHNVKKIDFENKKVIVENLKSGEIFEDNYDKLIITTGSWPIIPDIPGINLPGVKLSKNFNHAQDIINSSKNARNIVVIGAGYIGVELAEAFQLNGKNVTLIDIEKRILSKYLDKEFTDVLEKRMKEAGINFALGERVIEIIGNGKVEKLRTDKNEYKADLVILCVGFKPNTELFRENLKMLPNGAIITDDYLQTNIKDVYAAGDCCAVKFTPTNSYEYIPLATNAVRMGTIIAYNLFDEKVKYQGTQGTSGVKIYEYNVASTGLSETLANSKNIDVESVVIKENNKPEFMPDYREVIVKLVYRKDNKVIVGAQIISRANITEAINTMSLAIKTKMKIEDLAFADFFFQPHFNKPWNFLNTVALQALK